MEKQKKEQKQIDLTDEFKSALNILLNTAELANSRGVLGTLRDSALVYNAAEIVKRNISD
ncbi:protein of unknown function [Tenacibaculum sp. 190524A02b]|uniref:hypothetical protein n=1 Tax=Tenacibaculum vairaonense TaxID=3137860 RepID=UPI0032B0FDA8